MKTLLSIALALFVASCSSSNNTKTPDAAVIREVDAAVDAPAAPDCFTGTPTTHDQLINACPAAGVTRIVKHPDLPLMNSDGSLPPLP